MFLGRLLRSSILAHRIWWWDILSLRRLVWLRRLLELHRSLWYGHLVWPLLTRVLVAGRMSSLCLGLLHPLLLLHPGVLLHLNYYGTQLVIGSVL